MNISASFSMWIGLKPVFSWLLNSFIFKFTSHVSENCFFELNKETSYEIDKVRKLEYEQDKSYVIEFCMFFDLHWLSLRAIKSLIVMSNLREINELDFITCFFPAYRF